MGSSTLTHHQLVKKRRDEKACVLAARWTQAASPRKPRGLMPHSSTPSDPSDHPSISMLSPCLTPSLSHGSDDGGSGGGGGGEGRGGDGSSWVVKVR